MKSDYEFKRHYWKPRGRAIRTRVVDDALISVAVSSPPMKYFEIGSRFGYSLDAFLAHCHPHPEEIWICDIWISGGGRGHVQKVLDLNGFQGKVHWVEEDSTKVLPTLRGTVEVDLLLVDTLHTYKNASADIENGFHLLRLGGIMVVDDTIISGVKRAVDEKVEQLGMEILHMFTDKNGTAVLRRPA